MKEKGTMASSSHNLRICEYDFEEKKKLRRLYESFNDNKRYGGEGLIVPNIN